jgi:hypothetical protein
VRNVIEREKESVKNFKAVFEEKYQVLFKKAKKGQGRGRGGNTSIHSHPPPYVGWTKFPFFLLFTLSSLRKYFAAFR